MKYIKISFALAICLASSGISFGQSQQKFQCGTMQHWNEHVKNFPKRSSILFCDTMGVCDFSSNRDAKIPDNSTPVRKIKLIFQTFLYPDSSFIVPQDSIDQMMFNINADYAPYKIQFCYDVQYNFDTNYVNIDWWDIEDTMRVKYSIDPGKQINIFVCSWGSGPFGMGTFPWDPIALTNLGGILLDVSSVGPNGIHVLTHELGHNLGLWHVHHGVDETGGCFDNCYERVEYSAAMLDSTGDFCSDTPPSPTVMSCASDPGNDFCSSGNPPWGFSMPENYMSYAELGGLGCWNKFTSQQAGRMHCWTENKLSGYFNQCPPSGVEQDLFNKENIVSIYPNPFTTSATISVSGFTFPVFGYQLKIYDLLGREVHSQTLNRKQETLNPYLPSGMYFYVVKQNDSIFGKGKIIIQ